MSITRRLPVSRWTITASTSGYCMNTSATHPMAQGGSGNGHYGGKAEVYMDVGEAMGKAMVDLLQNTN